MGSMFVLRPCQKIRHRISERRDLLSLGDAHFAFYQSGSEGRFYLPSRSGIALSGALLNVPPFMQKVKPVDVTALEDAHFNSPFVSLPFLPFGGSGAK